EQANDPVWMGQKPFDFALNLKSVFPKNLLKGWPAPSLAQCTVNGQLVCLQDNLAQEVLYATQKLMKHFDYSVPTTWQQWAALCGGGRPGPAGGPAAALPLRWASAPLVAGQGGGGRWIVSWHGKNTAAAVDVVKWATSSFTVKSAVNSLSPGYPSYGPAAAK